VVIDQTPTVLSCSDVTPTGLTGSEQDDTPLPKDKMLGNARIRIDLTGTKYKVLREAA